MTRLVVVMPIYEDVVASTRVFRELESRFGDRIFVVAIDDGSVREPLDPVHLAAANVSGIVMTLRRNVGHQRAIAVGLSYVANEVTDPETIVVMDSDGEDMPQGIVELIQLLEANHIDVAVAGRRSRIQTLRFRVFYQIYKGLFRLLSGRAISFGNFMAMKPLAAKRLVAMQEIWIHLAACVLNSKLRIACCPLDRGPRHAGNSKMNFSALVLHGLRGLMVFADDVLLRIGIASAAAACFSMIAGIAALLLKTTGFAVHHWFPITLAVLFIVSMQTGIIALLSLLTGAARGVLPTSINYREFIDTIRHVERTERIDVDKAVVVKP